MESEDEITKKKIKGLEHFFYTLPENCQPKKNNSFMFLKLDHFYEGDYFRQVPIDEINVNPDYILPQDLLYKS